MSATGDLGDRLVAAINGVWGVHAGARAAHAKGSCCRGTFTATPAAAGLSRAAHLQGAPVPATVRFSNGSGSPTMPDYARDGRGMAVKLELPDGSHIDMVGLTLSVFFVRTPEDFMDFMAASVRDPATRDYDLARIGAFLDQHPETRRAFEMELGQELPASYLATRYFGIHSFRLVDAAGRARGFRYRWEPDGGAQATDREAARAAGREYLQDDLRSRLASGPARFALHFQMAAEGDPVDDATAPWPADREDVLAGHLELSEPLPPEACEALVFDPTTVVDGVECSDDPILHARSLAYTVSIARRKGVAAPGAEAGPGGGGVRTVEHDGTRVAVAEVDGRLYGFQDACTHRGCSLSEGTFSGTEVTCPCHGSVFDVTSGAVRRGPAQAPLRTFAVREVGGELEVEPG